MNLDKYKAELQEYILKWYEYKKSITPHGEWSDYVMSLGFKYSNIFGKLKDGTVQINIEHIYAFAKTENKTPAEFLSMIEKGAKKK